LPILWSLSNDHCFDNSKTNYLEVRDNREFSRLTNNKSFTCFYIKTNQEEKQPQT
jgi:hypothetical protein